MMAVKREESKKERDTCALSGCTEPFHHYYLQWSKSLDKGLIYFLLFYFKQLLDLFAVQVQSILLFFFRTFVRVYLRTQEL